MPVPDEVKGQPLRIEGPRDAAALDRLEDRLRVVGPRRFPALEAMLAAWLALVLALGVVADRRGVRAGLRIGALAVLWLPSLMLLTAAIQPPRTAEVAILVAGGLLLGALTDRFLAWPRGPGSARRCWALSCTSSTSPAARTSSSGRCWVPTRARARASTGSAMSSRPRCRCWRWPGWRRSCGRARARAGPRGRSALTGLALGAAIGAGRLGADVGGVVTVGAGTAVAVLLMLPGGVSRRAVAVAVLVPVLALAGLAVIDLATGGNGHFTRTVLRAEDSGALWDVVTRRYELAFNSLKRGLMPFATALALLLVAYGVRHRRRVYAPLRGDPAWTAALWGGLAAAVAGTLSNDSGPVLLLFGVAALGVATAYVRGDPRLAADEEPPRQDPLQGAAARTEPVGAGR